MPFIISSTGASFDRVKPAMVASSLEARNAKMHAASEVVEKFVIRLHYATMS